MHLTLEQEDALKELLNIGVGRAAGALNQIMEKPITLYIPTILLGTASELQKKLQEFGDHSLSTVQLPFKGSYAGSAMLAFPTETAPKLVEILTGAISDEDELNAMKVATLTEIGNIVLNGVMGSITNVLSGTITYSVPTYNESPVSNLVQSIDQEDSPILLWAQTRFTVTDYNISGDIFLVFDSNSFDTILEAINTMTGQPT